MSRIESTQNLALYDSCPIGAIIAFPAAAIANGWLECNGQAVSRVEYPELFSLISTTHGVGDGSSTFNLPDYRGVFLRGKDNGKGYDPGRGLGNYQADAFQGHRHRSQCGTGGGLTYPDGASPYASTSTDVVLDPITDGISGTPRTAAETRPKNVSVVFCIKAQNIVITALSTVSTYAALTHTTHQGEAVSFGANGYKKFADGLILQWGSFTSVTSVSFPIVFPNAVYSVTIGANYVGVSSYMGVYPVTTSGFTCTSNSNPFWYQAVGR